MAKNDKLIFIRKFMWWRFSIIQKRYSLADDLIRHRYKYTWKLIKNINSNTITGITYYLEEIMRVTSKGQVTVPQEIREKLGITTSV